jgi:uncharacterized protein
MAWRCADQQMVYNTVGKVLFYPCCHISESNYKNHTNNCPSILLYNQASAHLEAENNKKPIQMEKNKLPTAGNGKICYIEIPATDVFLSASFYKKVFGWKIRERTDGQIAFDDTIGEVSGTWIAGRNPTTEVGTLIYIMVDSVTSAVRSIIANGGKIIQPVGVDAPEITVRFSDPAGNIFGLYQEPAKE